MIDDATFTSGGPWLMTATRTDGALRFTAALGFSTAGDASVAPDVQAALRDVLRSRGIAA